MDPAKARRHIPEPSMFTYSSKDVILYALGVGANTAENFHFVYEGHNDFQVFPTFAVVPGILANPLTDLPGIQFDLSRVLHGEQYIELFAPFPPDGTQLRSEMRVADVLDKGANALIITEVTTFDDRTNEKLSFQQFGIIQGGAGGFGGNRTSPAERKVPPVPQGRVPDAVLEDKTRLDQAALYRLGSNDLNPLHIDANFAKMAGFQRPILHGLCTLGISCRLILQAFGQGLAQNLRSVKVRFSAPVEPGQTLVVEMWRHDAGGGIGDENNVNGTGANGNANNNKVLFQTKVKETGKVVLSNGCVELRELSVNDGIVPQQVAAAAEQLKAAEVFRTIGAELQKNSDKLRNIEDAVILYEITTGGQVAGKYTVELKAGEGHVYEGMPRGGQNAVATVRVDDADFVKLVGGQLDATRAFLSGRLKVKGKLALLQRIDALLRKTRNAQRSKL
uniref:MaoC-like domain-containing protein n=1 Tax=Globodera rostochiensis TaxID=31243 RepID=A0A914HE02_GLORO